MSSIIIDLTNFRDRTSARVPEGEYLVNVEDLEMGQTKKGDPMLTVYLKIVGGDQDGLNLVDRLTLSERAMFRVVGFLQGLGVKTPRKKISVDPSRIIGKKVRVEVADGEPYNGQVRSEIRSYMRIARTQEPEATDLDLAETADEFSEAPEEQAAPVETAEVSEVSETSDDLELDLDDIEI